MAHEFSSRIESQRRILKAVNSGPWSKEQLFSLTTGGVHRWIIANDINPTLPLIALLKLAAEEVFVMANQSQSPVTHSYMITKKRVTEIETSVLSEVSNYVSQNTISSSGA